MAISVVRVCGPNGTFSGPVTAGNTVFLIGIAYAGNTISSSNPTLDSSSVTGASKLQDGNSPTSNIVYEAIWMLPNMAGGGTQLGRWPLPPRAVPMSKHSMDTK